MKIKGVHNISYTDATAFHNNITKIITDLQNDGQTVEIQYQVNSFPGGQLAYSALILGRKDY